MRSLTSFIVQVMEEVMDWLLMDRLLPLLWEASETGRCLDIQDVLQRFVFDNICKVVKVSLVVQEEDTFSSDEPIRLGEEMVSKDRTIIGRAERLKRGLRGVKSRRDRMKAEGVNYVKGRKPLSVREERDNRL
ncbi:hypothetical protein SUGI_0639170 [Cryptomeria japonica]|nr:hypothetical protein SUGI_0639170 [Cryptomeria japonica]